MSDGIYIEFAGIRATGVFATVILFAIWLAPAVVGFFLGLALR